MNSKTRRLLAGIALCGAVIFGAGAPALAAHGTKGAAGSQSVPSPTVSVPPTSTSPSAVEIGTAAQWVREADGTVRRIR
ncbi:MAG TPA: hypothetical protein VHC41_04645 [Mycobacteriales bacterium]|jgi:hypothetical protein|nr:hypothetical protein [Mycobacteriales bacterium]